MGFGFGYGMDNGGAAGPGKVGLAAGRSDNGGDKIHGSKYGFLADDVAVVILKKDSGGRKHFGSPNWPRRYRQCRQAEILHEDLQCR